MKLKSLTISKNKTVARGTDKLSSTGVFRLCAAAPMVAITRPIDPTKKQAGREKRRRMPLNPPPSSSG
jgi:hypothetical protein